MPFAGQPPNVPADNPTAVYRRSFRLPAGWRRRRTHLRVGSADSMGVVWVNRRFVGAGTDSKLASTYDITDAIGAGNNDVTIAVPRWSAATWLEDQDQWWLPGLHRSVELVSVPHVSLADVALVRDSRPMAPRAPWTSTSRSPARRRHSRSTSPSARSAAGACTRRVCSPCRRGRRRTRSRSIATPTSGRDPACWPGSRSRGSRRGTTRHRRCTGRPSRSATRPAVCSTCARAWSASAASRSPTGSCS